MERRPKSQDDIRRQLTRIGMLAAERSRRRGVDLEPVTSLGRRLTADQVRQINELISRKPLFYEDKEGAESLVLLDDSIRDCLPVEFFDNPTAWIEAQPNISRHYKEGTLPTGETIEELLIHPYDVSVVKEIELVKNGRKIKVVSKRIRTQEAEELTRARKAQEAGIPTPLVLGEVIDRGNVYGWFEYIEGLNLRAALDRTGVADLVYKVPYTAFEEARVRELLLDQSFDLLNSKEKKSLVELWEQYLPQIIQAEATVVLTNRHFLIKPDSVEAIRSNLSKYLGDLAGEGLDQTLVFLGYESLEDYVGTVKRLPLEEQGDLLAKLQRKAYAFRDVFKEKWLNQALEPIFGCNPISEMNRIREKCEAAGLEHYDFNEKNFIVPWDFRKNRARKNGVRGHHLFLIDWEKR